MGASCAVSGYWGTLGPLSRNYFEIFFFLVLDERTPRTSSPAAPCQGEPLLRARAQRTHAPDGLLLFLAEPDAGPVAVEIFVVGWLVFFFLI